MDSNSHQLSCITSEPTNQKSGAKTAFQYLHKDAKKGELESAIKSALEFHLRFHKLVHLTMHKKAQNNSAKRDLKGTHLIGLEGCT